MYEHPTATNMNEHKHTHTHTEECDSRRQHLEVYTRLRLQKWSAEELQGEEKELRLWSQKD